MSTNQALLSQRRIDSRALALLLEVRQNREVDFLLIDIREPYEYEASHIVGVDRLLPTTQLQTWAPVLAEQYRNVPLILTCRTSNRTRQVQQILQDQLGMEKIIDHAGGIVTWQGPITQGMAGAERV